MNELLFVVWHAKLNHSRKFTTLYEQQIVSKLIFIFFPSKAILTDKFWQVDDDDEEEEKAKIKQIEKYG